MPPPGNIPAPLPPSVESAYRQKCIDLKKRINEVEESNDALRLRRARTKRGILKLRLERAFLLEQLAKRTATNVEDSDGSPSPPPPPQEKPLRTKRPHHRAPPSPARPPASPLSSAATPFEAPHGAFPVLNPTPDIPRSTNLFPGVAKTAGSTATSITSRGPSTPFAIYCAETRPALEAQAVQDADLDVDKALAQAWHDMGREGQAPYVEQVRQSKDRYADDGAEEATEGGLAISAGQAPSSPQGARSGDDGDVDMEGGDDAAAGAGGFTAVNR